MICKKDANFPYPILTNSSSGYDNPYFILNVGLNENINNYRFEIDYEISSPFIKNLLEDGHALLVLVIQSKDNKFYELKIEEKYIEIPKKRISLSKRTTIQLLIKAKNEISFKENNDLNPFYNRLKDQITLPKNTILGFSNTEIFDGSNSKPLDLFEKKINPNIKSDIEIELASETIIVNYKNEALQFNNLPKSSLLNNPYVYMGLQKALYRFIINNSADNYEVDLEDIDPPTNGLDLKLYNLMKKKMVTEVSLEKIDEVIYTISDRILEKFSTVVREMGSNGN